MAELCKRCDGDGDIEIVSDDPTLAPSKLVKCPDCNGTGQRDDDDDDNPQTLADA